jgi:hypothetical protein
LHTAKITQRECKLLHANNRLSIIKAQIQIGMNSFNFLALVAIFAPILYDFSKILHAKYKRSKRKKPRKATKAA